MKYRVACRFAIEVAHWTPSFPEGHPNRRLHGHSYEVELIAEGPLDDAGMIVSEERLFCLGDALKGMLDHRCLNDTEGAPLTMEGLAAWFLVRARLNLEEVRRVRVSRPTLGQWAEAEWTSDDSVQRAFSDIERRGQLEDRLEYDEEMLAKMYRLTASEAAVLLQMIHAA